MMFIKRGAFSAFLPQNSNTTTEGVREAKRREEEEEKEEKKKEEKKKKEVKILVLKSIQGE